ncbi:MAG: AAA family ATPase [Actinomycetales bacterium]|nr:AAA family ATPase [Actinomycetales bacterium]
MPPRVVFVGVPGAGKSTIAAEVARRLGAAHIDTDDLVATSAAMSVSDIFVTEGEAAFRARERAAVTAALQAEAAVVSLGGGAVIDPATRDDLRHQQVAWLQVSLSDAATRAGLNQARPLLLGNVRTTLARLLDERTPWYAEVATRSFDTSTASAEEIAEQVVRWLSAPDGGQVEPAASAAPADDGDPKPGSVTP